MKTVEHVIGEAILAYGKDTHIKFEYHRSFHIARLEIEICGVSEWLSLMGDNDKTDDLLLRISESICRIKNHLARQNENY